MINSCRGLDRCRQIQFCQCVSSDTIILHSNVHSPHCHLSFLPTYTCHVVIVGVCETFPQCSLLVKHKVDVEKKKKKIEYIDKQTASSACENGHAHAQHSLGWTGGVWSWRATVTLPVLQMTAVPLAISWHCSSLTHVARGYTQMALGFLTDTHPNTSSYLYLCGEWCRTLPSSLPWP